MIRVFSLPTASENQISDLPPDLKSEPQAKFLATPLGLIFAK
jgi:hypothetical protein